MNERLPTPYPELNSVLKDLVGGIQEILSTDFIGAYLQGSFAVGNFDTHSDVDFVIVTEKEPSDPQVNSLQTLHERIYNLESYWAQHLEGSYFPKDILRDYTKRGEKLWYLDNGSRFLIKSDHCNTRIVRWVLRENGIALAGRSIDALINPVPVEMLRTSIFETITEWGQEILTHPEKYNNRFYQTYIALSYCRMYHDLQMGFPGSKRAGADWAKSNLNPTWNDLIDKTWAGRPTPEISVRQPADPKDYERTIEFVRYIINKSKQYMASK